MSNGEFFGGDKIVAHHFQPGAAHFPLIIFIFYNIRRCVVSLENKSTRDGITMKSRLFLLSVILAVINGLLGCGGTDSPISPDAKLPEIQLSQSGHMLLGLYQFKIDPETKTLSFAQQRLCEMHLNITAFMEPPFGVNFGIEDIVDFQPGLIVADLFIRHPFDGVDAATVFDVCGTIITRGSNDYPYSETMKFAGDADVRLLNPDGYIRWWNPTEFPFNPDKVLYGYKDGFMGIPDSEGHFDSTINPYKYFATGMTDPIAGHEAIDPSLRGALIPGTKSVRRYEIAYDPGSLYFNYAIDANWDAPDMSDPEIVIPDDFPMSANRPEPYWLEIQDMTNSLSYSTVTGEASGTLSFNIKIWDWFDANHDLACAYSQDGELLPLCSIVPIDSGDGWAVYPMFLTPNAITSTDDIMVWIVGQAFVFDYQGFLPSEIQAMYIRQWVTVADQ
jgi:hypothetical protein